VRLAIVVAGLASLVSLAGLVSLASLVSLAGLASLALLLSLSTALQLLCGGSSRASGPTAVLREASSACSGSG
jgi:hypothetical protein